MVWHSELWRRPLTFQERAELLRVPDLAGEGVEPCPTPGEAPESWADSAVSIPEEEL